jgi:3-hydroxybutyryl-CoA dehydrogenase
LVAQGKTGMKSGAGFMPWSKEAIVKEKLSYDKRLKAAFEVLKLDTSAR